MREQAGLSQAALAELIGKKQTTVSRAEISGSGLGVEQIDAWATACKSGVVLRLGAASALSASDAIDALPEAERSLLLRIMKRLATASASKSTVLAQLDLIAQSLELERGSEMVAKAIESSSPRKGRMA